MCLFFVFTFCCFLTSIYSEETKFNSEWFLDQEEAVLQELNSLQIIRKFGYPAEAHEVVTADGYILQMHRIPYGKNYQVSDLENARKNKPPILIHHGIFGTSANFLLIGPEQGLPFLLADMGFDVWLGNFRGNTYSRAHVNLTSHQKKFWDFTWHESGIYDLPAEIDFVREFTHYDKIIYIGFSMGTTAFLVLTSVLPEYNDKILVAHLLAPVAYSANMKSPLVRFLSLTGVGDLIKVADEFLFSGEFLPNSPLFKEAKKVMCQPLHIQTLFCESLVFFIAGYDFRKINESLLRVFLQHFPAGYSVKGLLLYGINLRNKRFAPFDYGPIRNEIIYGSLEPPEYKVEKIRTPLYIYVGKNDFLSTIPDVNILTKRLNSLQSEYLVDYPKFEHLDFILSTDVKKQVYNQLIKDLTTFLENNTNYTENA